MQCVFFLRIQCIFSNKVSAAYGIFVTRNSVSNDREKEFYLHSKYRYKRVPICIHIHRIQLQTVVCFVCFLFIGFRSSFFLLCVCLCIHSASLDAFFSLQHAAQPFGTSKCNFALHTLMGHHGEKEPYQLFA